MLFRMFLKECLSYSENSHKIKTYWFPVQARKMSRGSDAFMCKCEWRRISPILKYASLDARN